MDLELLEVLRPPYNSHSQSSTKMQPHTDLVQPPFYSLKKMLVIFENEQQKSLDVSYKSETLNQFNKILEGKENKRTSNNKKTTEVQRWPFNWESSRLAWLRMICVQARVFQIDHDTLPKPYPVLCHLCDYRDLRWLNFTPRDRLEEFNPIHAKMGVVMAPFSLFWRAITGQPWATVFLYSCLALFFAWYLCIFP